MEQPNTNHTQSGAADAARGVIERVRDTATAQLSTQKDRATNGLGSIAQAVRQSAQPLREHSQDAIAGYVEKAADGIERFSSRLRERDVKDLVNDAKQLARKQPALFIGAAFVAGLIGARFLKSSAENGGPASGTSSRFVGASRTAGYGGGL